MNWLKFLLSALITLLFCAPIQTLGSSITTGTEKSLETSSDLPDFIITEVVFWYEIDRGTTCVMGSVKNIGETITSEDSIILDIAVYIDDHDKPILTQCPYFSAFEEKTWVKDGSDLFIVTIHGCIEKVKVVVDYKNKIKEKNENNNEKIETERSPTITIYGTVYIQDEKGSIYIAGEEDASVTYTVISVTRSSGHWKSIAVYDDTDSSGKYELLIPAKKPFSESSVYTLECSPSNNLLDYKCQTKNTDYLKPGDSYELDFTLIKKQKPKVSIRSHGLLRKSFLGRITSLKSMIEKFFETQVNQGSVKPDNQFSIFNFFGNILSKRVNQKDNLNHVKDSTERKQNTYNENLSPTAVAEVSKNKKN